MGGGVRDEGGRRTGGGRREGDGEQNEGKILSTSSMSS